MHKEFIFKGKIPTKSRKSKISYYSANPPDYRHSFTGSGLPFPNPEIAFDNTPNKGVVESVNGEFQIKLYFPNSFYTSLEKIYTQPTLYVKE